MSPQQIAAAVLSTATLTAWICIIVADHRKHRALIAQARATENTKTLQHIAWRRIDVAAKTRIITGQAADDLDEYACEMGAAFIAVLRVELARHDKGATR